MIKVVVVVVVVVGTNDFVPVVDYGPPAVSRVDGRINLDGQKLRRGLRVLLHLDSGDHTATDGDTVSTHREAHHLGMYVCM
jgi:hypothetical protein